MTLQEIIIAALDQDGRNTDKQTVNTFQTMFTRYANDAVLDIGEAMKLKRTDSLDVTDERINIALLPRECIRIREIRKDGAAVPYYYGHSSNEVRIPGVTGTVDVTYQHLPQLLKEMTDSPKEIPRSLHGLIVLYIGARIMMSGDSETQKRAASMMGEYERGKQKARRYLGEDDGFHFKNIYE